MPDLTYPLVITALIVYTLVLLLLNRANILSKFNIEVVWGFILMWRTGRGRKFINWLARPKAFWTFWGNLGIVTVVIFSVATFVLLLWEATIVVRIPVELAPGPEMLIGIPGLNPLIPVGYGIVSLAIAILIHEFSHGILTRVANVRIRSLGIIAILIPIGAFVEPDEQQLTKIAGRKRARVYAVGPMANITCAFLCALIFSLVFMGSVAPIHDGMVVTGVTVDYPAHQAGLRPGMLITAVSTDNFTETHIVSDQDFANVMAMTSPGDIIKITYYHKGETHTVQAKLADKYAYYKNIYPDPKYEKDLAKFKGVGFLGINTESLREDVIEAQAHPFRNSKSLLEIFGNGLLYVSLPILKLSPMPNDMASLIVVNGPLGALPSPVFWTLTNLFYWLFWLNFMVGATNALPARPLDGGHILKDGLMRFLSRSRPGLPKKRVEKTADWITWSMALLILFLIIWLVAGPYVAAGVRGLMGG
jgi:membrane-associated protease RseP (regulator of RpoE activity)